MAGGHDETQGVNSPPLDFSWVTKKTKKLFRQPPKMAMCCVAKCSSTAKNSQGVSFFNVPASKMEKLKWQKRIRALRFKTHGMQVCSLHFQPTDLFSYGEGENKGQKFVKKGAVPSRNLPPETPMEDDEIVGDSPEEAATVEPGTKSGSAKTPTKNGEKKFKEGQFVQLHGKIFCEICQEEMEDEIDMQIHLMGYKHKAKVKSKAVLERMKAKGRPIPEGTTLHSQFRCEACAMKLSSIHTLQGHIQSKKHKRNEKKAVKEGKQLTQPYGVHRIPTKDKCHPERGRGRKRAAKAWAAKMMTAYGEKPVGEALAGATVARRVADAAAGDVAKAVNPGAERGTGRGPTGSQPERDQHVYPRQELASGRASGAVLPWEDPPAGHNDFFSPHGQPTAALAGRVEAMPSRSGLRSLLSPLGGSLTSARWDRGCSALSGDQSFASGGVGSSAALSHPPGSQSRASASGRFGSSNGVASRLGGPQYNGAQLDTPASWSGFGGPQTSLDEPLPATGREGLQSSVGETRYDWGRLQSSWDPERPRYGEPSCSSEGSRYGELGLDSGYVQRQGDFGRLQLGSAEAQLRARYGSGGSGPQSGVNTRAFGFDGSGPGVGRPRSDSERPGLQSGLSGLQPYSDRPQSGPSRPRAIFDQPEFSSGMAVHSNPGARGPSLNLPGSSRDRPGANFGRPKSILFGSGSILYG